MTCKTSVNLSFLFILSLVSFSLFRHSPPQDVQYMVGLAFFMLTCPLYVLCLCIASFIDRWPDDVLEVTHRVDRVVTSVTGSKGVKMLSNEHSDND